LNDKSVDRRRDLLQFSVANQLLKTVARTSERPIRNKHAAGTSPRS
jgi:hypothetical protein